MEGAVAAAAAAYLSKLLLLALLQLGLENCRTAARRSVPREEGRGAAKGCAVFSCGSTACR